MQNVKITREIPGSAYLLSSEEDEWCIALLVLNTSMTHGCPVAPGPDCTIVALVRHRCTFDVSTICNNGWNVQRLPTSHQRFNDELGPRTIPGSHCNVKVALSSDCGIALKFYEDLTGLGITPWLSVASKYSVPAINWTSLWNKFGIYPSCMFAGHPGTSSLPYHSVKGVCRVCHVATFVANAIWALDSICVWNYHTAGCLRSLIHFSQITFEGQNWPKIGFSNLAVIHSPACLHSRQLKNK